MTRLLTDGAEMGDILSLSSASHTTLASTAQKRSGAYSYKVGYQEYASWNLSNSSELYIRFGFRIGGDEYNIRMFQWRYGTTILGGLTHGDGNKLQVSVGTTIKTTSTNALLVNTWYLIEVHVKIHDSTGIIEVRINGELDSALTFTGDTKPGADTVINNIYIIGYTGGWPGTYYFDDIAVNNTSGSEDNSWCGDGHIIALKPNANGDSSDWVGSDGNSTDNYLLVDEAASDGDTTYVVASGIGELDLYNLEACGLGDVTIDRVWGEARAKDTTTGSGILAIVLKTAGSEVDSDNLALTLAYSSIVGSIYADNPVSLSGWTVDDLDALQAGIKVIQ